MKLCDKIQTARKRAGLSQVDLADAMGVSRQSVSKWETGESNPDIGKLAQLAKVLNVSADWLLSEEEDLPDKPDGSARTEDARAAGGSAPAGSRYPEWMDRLPGFLLNAVKRYGWIYGVYIAVAGFIFAAFGFVIRLISRNQIFGGSSGYSGYDGFFPGTDPFSGIQQQSWSGFSAISWVAIGFGLLIMTGGIVLAVALKRWGQKNS
ncbi:MAG: helix-turn-helix transcriptional regulator [Lachnospiraceae bacterium]|nr:helix-turn-helix transcriptional regulator [Lachnospiraceae bacterium]